MPHIRKGTSQEAEYDMDDFEPLPCPAEGDWLTVRREQGQAYNAYCRRRTKGPKSGSVIYFVFLKSSEEKAVEPDEGEIIDFLQRYFHPTRVERLKPEEAAISEDVLKPRKLMCGPW